MPLLTRRTLASALAPLTVARYFGRTLRLWPFVDLDGDVHRHAAAARGAGFPLRPRCYDEDDVTAQRYDGCEVVVARGGIVAYHGCHGWADRAARRRVERGQPFITMSIGKQLTVALVLRGRPSRRTRRISPSRASGYT